MTHEEFERKVMTMLLDGNDTMLEILKKQYLTSGVIDRDFTGYGFFTNFKVSNDLTSDTFSGRIDDVKATIQDKEGEYLLFILYVTDGKIDTLECFTTMDNWDYNYDKAILEYCYENHREYDLK